MRAPAVPRQGQGGARDGEVRRDPAAARLRPGAAGVARGDILKALAFHRADRFQTARDLQHELGRFQLEWGQKTGALIDSGQLAAQLAGLVAIEHRVVAPRPPAEGDAARTSRPPNTDDSQPDGVPDPLVDVGSAPVDIAGLASGRITGASVASPVPAAAPSSGLAKHARPPTPDPAPARDTRERKYVYVLEGVLRGMAALERRVGAPGAARLVNEFYKVARDVAFKHEALDRCPAAAGRSPDTELPVARARGHDAPRRGRAADRGRGRCGPRDQARARAGRHARRHRLRRRARAAARARGAARRRAGQAAKAGPEQGAEGGADASRSRRRPRRSRTSSRARRAAPRSWSAAACSARRAASGTSRRCPRSICPTNRSPAAPRRGRPSTRTPIRASSARACYRLRGPKERAQRLRERARTRRAQAARPRPRAQGAARCVARRARHQAQAPDRDRRRCRASASARWCGRSSTGSHRGEAVVDPHQRARRHRDDPVRRDRGSRARRARARRGRRAARGRAPAAARAAPLIYPGRGDRAARRGPRCRSSACCSAPRPRRRCRARLGARGRSARERHRAGGEIDADARRQTLVKVLLRIESSSRATSRSSLVGEDIHWADQDSQELFAALLKVDTPRPIFGIMTSRPEPRILKLAKDLGTEVVAARRAHRRRAPRDARRAVRPRPRHRRPGRADRGARRRQRVLHPGAARHAGRARHPGRRRRRRRVPGAAALGQARRADPRAVVGRGSDRRRASTRLPPPERETIVHAAVLGRHVSAAALSRAARPAGAARARRAGPARPAVAARRRVPVQERHDDDRRLRADPARGRASRCTASVAARIASAVGLPPRPGRRADRAPPRARRRRRCPPPTATCAPPATPSSSAATPTRSASCRARSSCCPTTDHERRFTAHRQREEILRRLAKRPQQLRELHALRKEAEAIGESGKLAIAHCALAQFYIDVGKAPAALRAVAPALQYARDAGEPLARGRGAAAARGDRAAGRQRRGVAAARRAGARARRSRDGAEQGRGPGARPDRAARADTGACIARATILNQRGTTLWNIGRLEAIDRELRRGARDLPRDRDAAARGARAQQHGHRVRRARRVRGGARPLQERAQDRSGARRARGHRAQARQHRPVLLRPRRPRPRRELPRSRRSRSREQTGDLSAAADAAVSWGQTKLQRGDTQRRAASCSSAGSTLATENRERYQEIRALQYIALAHLDVRRSARGGARDGALGDRAGRARCRCWSASSTA